MVSFYMLLRLQWIRWYYCQNRGFTKFARQDYLKWKEENRIVNDGVNAKVSIGLFFDDRVVRSLSSGLSSGR